MKLVNNRDVLTKGVTEGGFDANTVLQAYNGGFVTADIALNLVDAPHLQGQKLDSSILSPVGERLMEESMYCISSEVYEQGLNRAWVAALAVFEKYQKDAGLEDLSIYQHKNNPECTVGTQNTPRDISTVPTLEAKVLEEFGFVMVNKWIIGRTIQPMMLNISNVLKDNGSLGGATVPTEPMIFVYPAYAYPNMKYKEAVGGGRQHTGLFLPFAITPGFAALAKLPEIDGKPVRILQLWLGEQDATDEDLIDAGEFETWLTSLPAPQPA